MSTVWKRLVPVVVLALILYAVVFFAYRWIENKVDTVLKPEAAERSLDRPGSGRESRLLTHEAAIQQILAHNIFKAALEGGSPQPAQDFRLSELAASSGPLELLGTVSGRDSDARAIIRSGADQREQLYRLGDTVQGAQIVRIERGRVALATRTGPELLLLKEREGGMEAPAPEAADLPEENSLLTPPQGQINSSRIVPQALPGRRINTIVPSRPNQTGAAGEVPVRTGAAALQPLEVPWEEPENPTGATRNEP